MLQIRKLFINRFVSGIFPMERRIAPIQSRPVAFILDYTPFSDLLAIYQNDPDAMTQ